jgi:hypothetical protein
MGLEGLVSKHSDRTCPLSSRTIFFGLAQKAAPCRTNCNLAEADKQGRGGVWRCYSQTVPLRVTKDGIALATYSLPEFQCPTSGRPTPHQRSYSAGRRFRLEHCLSSSLELGRLPTSHEEQVADCDRRWTAPPAAPSLSSRPGGTHPAPWRLCNAANLGSVVRIRLTEGNEASTEGRVVSEPPRN